MKLPSHLFRRKKDSHKGDYGHVLTVGSSPGLTGALALASLSALRCGAGLVTAAVPCSLNGIFERKLTEVMSFSLPDKDGCLMPQALPVLGKILPKVDVIALGPGAGSSFGTRKLILKIIKEVDKPMVIDADALGALAGHLRVLDERVNKNTVLTPHLGEFARLLGETPAAIKKRRKELVRQFAFRYNLTLVLKGTETLVCDGRRMHMNTSGNPGMATAGSGDVLCGVIAAFIAQGLEPFPAARLAVYLHGLAGDLAARDKTQMCLIASDIIDYLPKAVKSASR